MRITVLFFASLREKTRCARMEVELPAASTLLDLKVEVAERFPAAAALLAKALAAVNQDYALEHDLLPDGAEVAFFPPVSGGSTWPTIVLITEEALDIDDLVASITLETTGAVCVFSGMVRGRTTRGGAHETIALEYEAYQPMAEAKMAQVAEEIRLRWPTVEGIVLVQRIGRLLPKTPTILVACGAAHRDTGVFEAARYGIDRLKEIVPIWKKEIGADGEAWVEGEYHPHTGD